MKLLTISSLSDNADWRVDNTTSPVDQWRIVRPYQMLKKMTDWTVDSTKTFIPNFEKYRNVEDFDLDEQAGPDTIKRFSKYDLVISSYFASGLMYALAKLAADKTGTKLIIDIDDDWWNLPDDNPFWVHNTVKEMANVRWILSDVDYLTTTNEYLAERYRSYRPDKPKDSVLVLPNMISLKEYSHPPFDNGDKVVIGWFGGSSHYYDLNDTGFTQALQKLMHKHKNVEFHSCGAVIKEYLPRARVKEFEPQRGLQFLKMYKDFNFDIGVAPLVDREFAWGKSDIKWQEYAVMGAAFVGSDVGPYQRRVKQDVNGLLVKNTEDEWFDALESLVLDKAKRKKLQTNALKEVTDDCSIENNWQKVKAICEQIGGRRDNDLHAPKVLQAVH